LRRCASRSHVEIGNTSIIARHQIHNRRNITVYVAD
jgi:hypothetical protein